MRLSVTWRTWEPNVPPPPIGTLSQIFSIFYFDASPNWGFSCQIPNTTSTQLNLNLPKFAFPRKWPNPTITTVATNHPPTRTNLIFAPFRSENVWFEKNFSKQNFVFKNFLVKKNIWSKSYRFQKNFGSKNFGSKKLLGPKRFWVQKSFGSKKIFGPKKIWVQKNFWSKRFWVQKNFGYKKNLVKKILGHKILDPKNNYCFDFTKPSY